ncbi:MAG: hypothetical protein RMM98_12100 [Acidobacteriota bacterium]|nr:hypothetical protein [Blastocatellia bacterium]MDW8240352.1 hypothetical protein [Acidobacteriota bacterium]
MPDPLASYASALLDFVDVNLFDERHLRKFSGFMPWGKHHMLGLRLLEPTGRPNIMYGLKNNTPFVMDIIRPGERIGFLPAELPHHLTGDYGWWHINTTEEIYIPVTRTDDKIAFVIVESLYDERYDQFVWYCPTCYRRLFGREVNTGRLGVDGYWKAERAAVEEFNSDERLRLCQDCGTVHPKAYSFFAPEEEKSW